MYGSGAREFVRMNALQASGLVLFVVMVGLILAEVVG